MLYVLTVDEVSNYVRDLFDADPVLVDVWVRGEVSNFRPSAAGHCYFSLKSERAQIRAVLFRSEAETVRALPRDGDAVIAHGRISSYPAWGQYQLYVDAIEPEGAGLLQLRLQELQRRLESEGLFDTSRKRPLPPAPRSVGVVTSPTGSVWQDIRNVLSRRYPLCELILSPSTVQGERAPAELIAALERLQSDGRSEVIIIARGGGSIEDLWAFNDEALVRTVYRCSAPVVSAIGHETDVTLCDLVADLRAPTPSAAAELVAPHIREHYADLSYQVERLTAVAETQIADRRNSVSTLSYRLKQHSPRGALQNERLRIDHLGDDVRALAAQTVRRRRAELVSYERELRLLHPARVLERGYAIVTSRETGRPVKDVASLSPASAIRLHFHDGHADARTEAVEVYREVKQDE